MISKEAPATGADASRDPLIGRQLGDYRLTSILATGGMARIYKGTDYKLQRQAAVKVLAQEQLDSDQTLARRFQREARAVAALEHDHIITIYQYGEQDGIYFLAMKLVKGKDLAQELRRLKRAGQRMEVERALRILGQVASALDFAHAAGVIHRDIKPSNILLDESDKAILTDFGLVLRASAETTMGTAFGTPRYIAPEQAISSNKAVPQSDVYALSVILYEILTGETPFNGESPMEIALSQINDPPPPPRSLNPNIPEAVERELLKGLAKEPEERHASATAFVQAVRTAYQSVQPATPASQPRPADSARRSSQPQPADASDVSTDMPVRRKAAAPAAAASQPAVRGRWGAAAAALAVVGVAVVGLLAALVGGGGGASPTVTLWYEEGSFTMHNGGEAALDLRQLRFVRGVDGDRDDYSGERVKGKTLPARSCARVRLMEFESDPPPACQDVQSVEMLYQAPLMFWRAETPDGSTLASFEVWVAGERIARCDTVAAGQQSECRFPWPVEAVIKPGA